MLGLHSRNHSPAVLDKIVSANAEHKSAATAQKMLQKLAEIKASVPLITELTGMVGRELEEHVQHQATSHAQGQLQPQHAEPPQLAAVSVDGGRIMTRADAGRGVHVQQWKETKNACLLTMSGQTSADDPHPELPRCFSDRNNVTKLVREIHSAGTGATRNDDETPVKLVESPADASSSPQPTSETAQRLRSSWRPERLVRTCLSSMVSSHKFGPLVAGAAQRRGFYQAQRRAFLGDGQAWNWTLHETYFPNFVPIADFVHPLGYLYDAARVLAPDDPWPVYLAAATACWQGRVGDVLHVLAEWQHSHPTAPDEQLPEDDPRAIVQTASTYLHNNQCRMKYPEYRRAGLPISSSMIESLIKEINYRVKGTEKFWNRPEGAEQILQVRAAALSDDDRLSQWILNRPGSYFHRTSTEKKRPLATAA